MGVRETGLVKGELAWGAAITEASTNLSGTWDCSWELSWIGTSGSFLIYSGTSISHWVCIAFRKESWSWRRQLASAKDSSKEAMLLSGGHHLCASVLNTGLMVHRCVNYPTNPSAETIYDYPKNMDVNRWKSVQLHSSLCMGSITLS